MRSRAVIGLWGAGPITVGPPYPGQGRGRRWSVVAGRSGGSAGEDDLEIPGVGSVESWVDLIEVSQPLVTFRWTYVFAADGQVLTSDSTLCFREREEVESDLVAHGYVVQDVRDAPDRPGREFVFLARRP